MSQSVFKSKYPILEACMNRGSTLPLALAVHNAGGYASLCSWSYDRNWDLMKQQVQEFQTKTQSNQLHVSFELEELTDPKQMHDIVLGLELPTVELIYGMKSITQSEFDDYLRNYVKPLRDHGVKVFRRATNTFTEEQMESLYLDGLMLKGRESAGVRGPKTVRDFLIEQKQLTPHALLVPYGGVGLASQVADFLNIGAEIVGCGTVLAFSKDSPIKPEAKQWVKDHNSRDLKTYTNYFQKTPETLGIRKMSRNALEFQPYQGPDPWNGDENRTASLITGLYDRTRNDGHLMVGGSINHIHEIRSVDDIIRDLCSEISV